MQTIPSIFEAQKDFYDQGKTRSYSFRKKALKALLTSIKKHEKELTKALHDDLHKPATESYLSEIGFMYQEIRHHLQNLHEWMEPRKQGSPFVLFPSRSFVYNQPQGMVLILGPWNYPFQLLMAPLVAAVAAGNCVMVKSSNQTPETARVTKKIIEEVFQKEHVSTIDVTGCQVIPQLIEPLEFNHIFFTGSVAVGKLIMKAAAEKLTKVTLELGGKSPCIVDKDVNLSVAAKRIAWAKAFNAGQTCVAPDYLIVHEDVKDELLTMIAAHFDKIIQEEGGESLNFGHIINTRRFDALVSFLSEGKIKYGGKTNREQLYIQPTIITDVDEDSSIMQEEIFGPILPVLTWSNENDIYDIVGRNPYPLALYVYTKNKKFEQKMIHKIPFGGGAINNCLVHLSDPDIPFGGFQTSGMGNYHGKEGFEAFTHKKSIIKTGTWFDLPLKYAPYSIRNLSWIKRFMR